MDTKEYTYKDNIELIKEYKETGNDKILDVLVLVNYSLVKKETQRYRSIVVGTSLDEEDLDQVGFMGLLRAIEKFDLEKNTSFSTYALYWIKQYITREISNKKNSIRIPIYMVEEILKYKKIKETLDVDITMEKQKEALKEGLKVSDKKLKEIEEAIEIFGTKVTSLDIEVGEDEKVSLSELISADDSLDIVYDFVEKKSLVSIIRKSLEKLPERYREILELRYGLYSGEEKTLEEIGKIFGLSRERIRQIEKRALSKLREDKDIQNIK